MLKSTCNVCVRAFSHYVHVCASAHLDIISVMDGVHNA